VSAPTPHTPANAPLPNAAAVVAFWRSAGPARWYAKDATFDAEIRARFFSLHEAACHGKLQHWEKTESGTLALILVLDQFSRNMFRDDARAFASDPQALTLARRAVDRGMARRTPPPLQQFFFLPFMHAENLADQLHCVELCRAAGLADNLRYAEIHADVIRRFGRFPHRNRVLGRATTPEEQAFLDSGGFAG
jgi:uncharacterized protein (DUF924 family)